MKGLTTKYFVLLFIVIVPASTLLALSKGDDKILIKEKSFKIAENKKVNVYTSGGDVSITSWDKSEVYVKIIGNENAAKKYDYTFYSNEDEVTIKAERKSGWDWFSNTSLKIEVKVPPKFNIYTSTSGGDIKVGGVNGGINLETSGGDIWGDRIEGNFKASTSGGDIKIFSNNAKIEASTSGGDITVEYTGSNLGIDVETSGGDIDIIVPSDFNAKAELETSGGDVECNLTLNDVKKLSSTKIIGNINNGGNLLSASTSGGDISVRKK